MTRADDDTRIEPASLAQSGSGQSEALTILESVAARLASDIGLTLTAMGLEAAILPLAPQLSHFGAWRDSLPPHCAVAECQIEGQAARSLLSVPTTLVARLTDIFFGGDGDFAPPATAMTLTEERLFRRLAGQLATAHARALRGAEAAEITGIGAVRDELRHAREGDAIVIQTFSLTRGKTALGRIEIIHMVAHLRHVAAEPEASVKDPTHAAWRRTLEAAVAGVHLPVRSIIAQPNISLEKLLTLKPGDIIPIVVPERLPLIVSGMIFASGSIGEANGRAALRIEQVERPRT